MRMLVLWLALGLVLIWASASEAACSGGSPTWNASNDDTSVQDCVNRAINGDTINIAAGSATWTSQVSWTNKQIYLKGAGQGSTVITNGGFVVDMTGGGTFNWRISDLTLIITTPMSNYLAVRSGSTNSPTKGWRLDHMTITHTGTGQSAPLFYIHGITWGLIDHVTFNGNGYQIGQIWGYTDVGDETVTCSPHCLAYNYWNRNLNLGTDEAIYFEDVTINFTDDIFGASVFDMPYGGSVVVRHSTITGAFMQTHATGHQGREYGGMKYEFYNNTFTGSPTQYLPWAFIRSGTGVAFNNTVTGYQGGNIFQIDGQREAGTSCSVSASPMLACNGASSFDGNIESGWPCVSACGRGAVAGFDGTAKTQANVPIYGWNNGTTTTCAIGGSCANDVSIVLNGACGANLATYIKTTGSPHSNGQVDYVNNGSTPKPGYAAFTYPHPLQTGGGGGSSTPPPAPTGLLVR